MLKEEQLRHFGTQTRLNISRIPMRVTVSPEQSRRATPQRELWNQRRPNISENNLSLIRADGFENVGLKPPSNPSSKKTGIAFCVDASSHLKSDNEEPQTQNVFSDRSRYADADNNLAPISPNQEIQYFPNTERSRNPSGAFFLRKMLEEERNKRINSELLIQQLQNRLSECEEKLVTKDNALYQLQNDWSNLISRWRNLEEMVCELRDEKDVLTSELREMVKKKPRGETDLGSCPEEVCEKAKNKDEISVKYREPSKDVSGCAETRKSCIKNEFKEQTLNGEAKQHGRNEKSFYEKIEKLLKQNEKKEYHNLRKYQIEIITRNKNRDPEHRKATLEREVRKREEKLVEISANHIKHLAEKHDAELKLLEEKHKEELRLRDLQICDSLHELEKHKVQNSAILRKLKRNIVQQFNSAINLMSSSPTSGESSEHLLGIRRSNSDSQIHKQSRHHDSLY